MGFAWRKINHVACSGSTNELISATDHGADVEQGEGVRFDVEQADTVGTTWWKDGHVAHNRSISKLKTGTYRGADADVVVHLKGDAPRWGSRR